MVPSSRTLVEDHQEFKKVQSTKKRIKNIRRGPREKTAQGGDEQH
jgi:hypothetical protein